MSLSLLLLGPRQNRDGVIFSSFIVSSVHILFDAVILLVTLFFIMLTANFSKLFSTKFNIINPYIFFAMQKCLLIEVLLLNCS